MFAAIKININLVIPIPYLEAFILFGHYIYMVYLIYFYGHSKLKQNQNFGCQAINVPRYPNKDPN